MERIRIILLDRSQQEIDEYGKLCRKACAEIGYDADIRGYLSEKSLLFDMEEPSFSAKAGILVVEPELSDAAAGQARGFGFGGVILYLSGSASLPHVLSAFDAGAFNYLLKGPEHHERLRQVVQQAARESFSRQAEYILVSRAGECRRIEVKDIRYFEAFDHNIVVHYGNSEFEFTASLSDLEKHLKSRGFLRIHRSFLVSLAYVRHIGRESVILDDHREIPVGRTQYTALKHVFRLPGASAG